MAYSSRQSPSPVALLHCSFTFKVSGQASQDCALVVQALESLSSGGRLQGKELPMLSKTV